VLTSVHPAVEAAGAVDVVVDAGANVVEAVWAGRVVVEASACGVGEDEPQDARNTTPSVIAIAVMVHRGPAPRGTPAGDRGTGPA
jgi:hypothetical protein